MNSPVALAGCDGASASGWNHLQKSTARALAALVLFTALFSSLLTGCAGSRARDQNPSADALADASALVAVLSADAPSDEDAAVRVRLAFGGGADLDLYVTDTTHETVYFANSPTRVGGRLQADLRCGDPAPRVETVVFPTVRPGIYRVGVDFPERCEGGPEQVGFAVRIEAPGVDETRPGAAEEGIFDSLFLEVTVGP